MSNDPERWSIHDLDDKTAEVAQPPDRWGRRWPTRPRTNAAGALLIAALVLVGFVLTFVEPPRTPVAEPASAPGATFSRNDSGTALPSEAEIWGAAWSRAEGVAVLRPMWLPKSKDEYQVVPGGSTSRDGLFVYSVSYLEMRSAPGGAVWNVQFFAESLDERSGGLIQFGGVPEAVTIRGHEAQLSGNGSPGWVLVWSEGNYRYAIQAFAVSRDDLLRIAQSLAPVIDEKGKTR